MNPLSGVIGEAWQMYRAHWKHLLAIAAVIYLIAAIVSGVLGLLGIFGLILALVVSILATFLLQAALVKAVQDVRDGRADLSISETVNAALPYIWRVTGAGLLAAIAIIVGLFLIIVPGLILITIWAVFVPVIVIEGSSAMASFGRSRELVRGRAWHVFGTLVLVWLIMIVANYLLRLIFSALPYSVAYGLSSFIAGILIAPFIALVVTLMYYRLQGSMAPAGGGMYSNYAQPQDGGYGSYQQPQAGWQQPPQGGGYGSGGDQPTQAGGWQQPPQGGNYGGYQQPPQGSGYQQPPQGGGYQGDQPTRLGGYQQPPQDAGYQQPPQGGGYAGDQPTRQVPRYTGPEDDDSYGNR